MNLWKRSVLSLRNFYRTHKQKIDKGIEYTLKGLMFLTTFCALVGLSALVFFMCEQAMFDFGIYSFGIVYIGSAVGSLIVFMAHVATWGKESFRTVDWFLGKIKHSNDYLPSKTWQKVAKGFFLVMALLGTCVFSFSSYLGFLSMATALGATGAFLAGIKIFGLICTGAMLISAGLFCVNSMLDEVNYYFNKMNLRQQKLERRKQGKLPRVASSLRENLKKYIEIKRRNMTLANVVGYLLALGNALGDVILKSFAFSHWLVLIGLATAGASGAISFSPLGFSLLILAGISTFVLSMTTEGIRLVAIGQEIGQRKSHKAKAELIPHAKVPKQKPRSTIEKLGRMIGRLIAFFVSLMSALPALTSSLSKVAGLGAMILWILPGMHTTALVVSLILGTFFFISKFVGYYGQSGTYIINGVASSTEEYQTQYIESYQRLTHKQSDNLQRCKVVESVVVSETVPPKSVQLSENRYTLSPQSEDNGENNIIERVDSGLIMMV